MNNHICVDPTWTVSTQGHYHQPLHI